MAMSNAPIIGTNTGCTLPSLEYHPTSNETPLKAITPPRQESGWTFCRGDLALNDETNSLTIFRIFEEGLENFRLEVDQDGEMFARMAQEVDKSGEQPAVVKTSLDIPSRNLHKTIEQIAPQHHDKRNMFSQRPKSMDNNVS
ncbi:hypothetical protein AAG570_010333 [Ranatra chinensis]|uniref:Uncharacterized protein n=1 Tax=Ranatra chinensis TaxID=642074 RepID=A0ABD0YM87_9HEMI